jgi:hypothetical protein
MSSGYYAYQCHDCAGRTSASVGPNPDLPAALYRAWPLVSAAWDYLFAVAGNDPMIWPVPSAVRFLREHGRHRLGLLEVTAFGNTASALPDGHRPSADAAALAVQLLTGECPDWLLTEKIRDEGEAEAAAREAGAVFVPRADLERDLARYREEEVRRLRAELEEIRGQVAEIRRRNGLPPLTMEAADDQVEAAIASAQGHPRPLEENHAAIRAALDRLAEARRPEPPPGRPPGLRDRVIRLMLLNGLLPPPADADEPE